LFSPIKNCAPHIVRRFVGVRVGYLRDKLALALVGVKMGVANFFSVGTYKNNKIE